MAAQLDSFFSPSTRLDDGVVFLEMVNVWLSIEDFVWIVAVDRCSYCLLVYYDMPVSSSVFRNQAIVRLCVDFLELLYGGMNVVHDGTKEYIFASSLRACGYVFQWKLF